jgi:dTDP-4-amino-4,6-dideoxygalactose transaminase
VAQITEDLRGAGIEAVLYPPAMHRQRLYLGAGEEVARLPKTDQIAPRLVVLPLHTHMTEEDVSFIVGTLKDATVNVGAGAAIY